MRIGRFSAGQDPFYGVISGELDEYGQTEDDAMVVEIAGDPLYSGVVPTEKQHRLSDLKFLTPVIPRSKVVGIGRNYAAHASEMGNEVPKEPLVFLKPNTSVIGPGDAIAYPQQSSNVHFEGELALVIGRICRDVPADPAAVAQVIFGYTIGNDVTARDLQRSDVQFTRGKGFDTFCPLGPWIDTGETTGFGLEKIADGVQVQTYLNGDLKQDGSTRDLIFDIPTLIAYVSSVMTLLPGDVILTGTPSGVGPMEVGDEVEIAIEGLGALTNTVARRE